MRIKLFSVLVIVFILSLIALGFNALYVNQVRYNATVLFDKNNNSLTISFKYPVPEKIVAAFFSISPDADGQLTAQSSHLLGLSQTFVYKADSLNKDTLYNVTTFDSSYTFAIPAPHIKDISYTESSNQLIVNFTNTVDDADKSFVIDSIQLTAGLNPNYEFSQDNKQLIITLSSVKNGNSYTAKILDKDLSFSVSNPQVTNLYFDSSRKYILANFSKPVSESYITSALSITPPIKYNILLNSTDTQAIITPLNIVEGNQYSLILLGKNISFKVNKVAPSPQPGSSSDGKYIEINLTKQTLTAWQNGNIIEQYRISSGKASTPTPTGTFYVISKEINHWSNTFHLYMPYSLKFSNLGYYIHELPYWPGGYREGVNHLGIPVSHGCVRLGIGSAEKVYNFADLGMKIIIHK